MDKTTHGCSITATPSNIPCDNEPRTRLPLRFLGSPSPLAALSFSVRYLPITHIRNQIHYQQLNMLGPLPLSVIAGFHYNLSVRGITTSSESYLPASKYTEKKKKNPMSPQITCRTHIPKRDTLVFQIQNSKSGSRKNLYSFTSTKHHSQEKKNPNTTNYIQKKGSGN